MEQNLARHESGYPDVRSLFVEKGNCYVYIYLEDDLLFIQVSYYLKAYPFYCHQKQTAVKSPSTIKLYIH